MKKAICHLIDLSTILVFYLIFWACVVFFAKLSLSLDNLYINAPFLALKKLSFPYPNWFQYSFLGALGVAVFVPVLNPFRTKSGEYGSAHFADEKEIKKMGLRDDQGIILAVKGRKYIRTNKPLSVNVYAPPSTGKTAAIIIPTLISCSNSMIVHDPKGELYAKTHKRRSEFSRVIKFSPGEKGSFKWNPLSKEELPKGWADRQVHVERVAQVVIADDPAKPNDHWPAAARSFFMFWALFLVYRDGETSLPGILKEPYNSRDIQEYIGTILDDYGEKLPERIKFEGNGLLNSPEGEFGSIQSTFKTKMSVFFDERVAENVSGSDFKLSDLRKECTTIYLTVKNNDQSRLKSLIGLFFEISNSTILDHTPTKDEFAVICLLDEAARIAKMQEIINMPAIGRSYKFTAIFIWQSPGQVNKIYGKEDAKEIKNTCAYHVYFTQNDVELAEEVSKSIGDLTREKINYSGSGKGLTRSKSESNEGFKLLMAQDILSMPIGTILILSQNHFKTPILAKAAFWFKDSALKCHVEDVEYEDMSKEEDQDQEPDESLVIVPPVKVEDSLEDDQNIEVETQIDIELYESGQEDEDLTEIITAIDNEINDMSLEDEESTIEDEETETEMDMEDLMKGIETEIDDIPTPDDQTKKASFL